MAKRIYFGETQEIIVEQEIGDKIWDKLSETYEVKRLSQNGDIIMMIREKQGNKEND